MKEIFQWMLFSMFFVVLMPIVIIKFLIEELNGT